MQSPKEQSSCWLILYGDGGDGSGDENENSVRGSRIDNDCIKRADPALDSVSDSFFKTEEILSSVVATTYHKDK